MRLSQLFSKTSKNAPAEEEAINAKLLTRAGYIRKLSAGVYAYLPLGWRVLDKINRIIREEMNAIGGQELLMSTLVAKEYWEKSGRWDTDVAFKTQLPASKSPEFALGWTHEEVITHIATNFINSYQDLPLAAYQIQTKFRAEARAKSGILRGREFMMKDLYSFHADKKDLDDYYQKVSRAYLKIFKRLGLKVKIVEASGGSFTKEYTHEFQVSSPVGEDIVFYCSKCDWARNKELVGDDGVQKCPQCLASPDPAQRDEPGEVQQSNASEVGNIFKLGTRYSDAFGLKFKDKNGASQPVIMGSYGIGQTRVMGALVETSHDDRGIIWPESVSPYQVHLVSLAGKNGTVAKTAESVYNKLQQNGVEVLFDDRSVSAGEKLADADLLGISWRAVVSEKTGSKIELKKRSENKAKMVDIKKLVSFVCNS